MGRPPCCDKSNVKRGLWTAEEDAKILAHVSTHGTGNWTSVPKKAGLKRCGKSCRLRWTNYLRPDLKHESFTPQEEELIVTLHATIGSRWSLIAGQLPGRTDNDVKNYWNTKLRKKLCEMGIDPVTHKPISQILADYRSIGLLKGSSSSSKHDLLRSQPLNNARISCLSKDLRNAFMSKSKPAQTTTQNDIPNFSMPTTKMEDGILNNNPTWDLLAQLHAIKLVTDASNCTNQQTLFLNEASSSTAPSIAANHQGNIEKTVALPTFSSQPSQPQDIPSPSSFSWSEFLLEDVFLPLEQQDSHVLSSTDSSSLNPELEVTADNESYYCNEFAVPAGDGYCYTDQGYNMFGGVAGSASANSFVETILDRDSEMSWDFPDILNDP